jgi:hypothetical protein
MVEAVGVCSSRVLYRKESFNWLAFAAGLLCGVFAATTLFRHGVDHAIFDEIVYAVFTPLRQSRALNRKLTEGL